VILVTGATGFIGSYVVADLRRRGHDVLAVTRTGWRPENRHVIAGDLPELAHVDLGDSAAVAALVRRRRPEAIIHLGALVDPVALATNPVLALDANVRPGLDLLDAARAHGVGRFVLGSSVAVLPRIRVEPIRADHPLVTESGGSAGGFYGVAKAVAEITALGYAEAFGIDVRIVRPSAVYGFGMQWPIGIKPVVEALATGDVARMPRHAPPRDYTPVQDVASIISALAEGRGHDVVVNAGTGGALTTNDELIATMSRVFPGGRIEVSDDDLDPQGVESGYRGVLDMTAAREQLGVHPTFPTLDAGLAAYAEAFRRFRAG